ncbi:MAG: hypothetical protein J6A54_03595 [Clostridia bacterium]|nr:hypothetical protein [Clostridia bacterium]
MAKKIYGIADAMRSEVKTEEPVRVESTPAIIPAVEKKEAKKRGRPRKVEKEARTAFVRTSISASLKKKLQIVCISKGISEDAYAYDLLERAINRDYEKALASVTE